MIEQYGLETGAAGERRLDLVQEVYGQFCTNTIGRIQLPQSRKRAPATTASSA